MTERENPSSSAVIDNGKSSLGLLAPAFEYAVDAAQRSILFWDVMRRRGNQYREHLAEVVPHVLDYEVELVIDGRQLERPVNYALARVIPPAGIEVDPTRRPFVIVDPRAGHGPGIGGFKADSEIGVALKAGHTAISSASCRSRCPARRSRISPGPKQCSWSESLPNYIRKQTASPA